MDLSYGARAMAVISLKLTEDLDAQLTAQAQRRRLSKSELVRRELPAFLQSSEQGGDGLQQQSAADLLADLVGCCEDGPADLSSNPAYLSDFGTNLSWRSYSTGGCAPAYWPTPPQWPQKVLGCFWTAAMPDQGGIAVVVISTREQQDGKNPVDNDDN